MKPYDRKLLIAAIDHLVEHLEAWCKHDHWHEATCEELQLMRGRFQGEILAAFGKKFESAIASERDRELVETIQSITNLYEFWATPKPVMAPDSDDFENSPPASGSRRPQGEMDRLVNRLTRVLNGPDDPDETAGEHRPSAPDEWSSFRENAKNDAGRIVGQLAAMKGKFLGNRKPGSGEKLSPAEDAAWEAYANVADEHPEIARNGLAAIHEYIMKYRVKVGDKEYRPRLTAFRKAWQRRPEQEGPHAGRAIEAVEVMSSRGTSRID